MQTKEIDLFDQPLTNLIYKEEYRNENESILVDFQKILGETKHCRSNPFATLCLRNIYRGMANDYIFSKNTSVILSSFTIEYTEKLTRTEDKEIKRKLPGLLLLNVNAENRVGTFIMSVSFTDFDVDQCIYLKHVFFKNCEVVIAEKAYKSTCILDKGDCDLCVLKNEKSISTGIYESTTIRDYIKNKSPFNNLDLDEKIDFRCRYTYLEIDKLQQQESRNDNEKEKARNIYALITSDEYYKDFNNDIGEKNQDYIDIVIQYKHPVSLYKVYLKESHALQINRRELPINDFDYKNVSGYIAMNDFHREKSCIAGVSHKDIFPKYLKAVEIHYLINNETTNEISPKERSYINPIVFIRRAIRLWKVIYEVDTNKYHNSSEFMESFGINKLLKELRDEYNNLLVHIVGFFTIMLTLLTLFFSILQVVGS